MERFWSRKLAFHLLSLNDQLLCLHRLSQMSQGSYYIFHGFDGVGVFWPKNSVSCIKNQYFTLPGLFHVESMEGGMDCRNSRWIPWNGGWNPWNGGWIPWNGGWIPYFWWMDSMEWWMDSMVFPHGFHTFSILFPYGFHTFPYGFHTFSSWIPYLFHMESSWNKFLESSIHTHALKFKLEWGLID